MSVGSRPPSAESGWAYFLDVDGTLVPLASTPGAARVSQRAHSVVRNLHAWTNGAVALVSGRAIAELDRLFGNPGMPAAGQHGAEFRSDSTCVLVPPSEDNALTFARTAFREFVARHDGLLLEDKGLSLAVHYRLAPSLASSVHRMVRAQLRSIGDHYHLLRGNRVIELRPAGTDKGKAIAAFMARDPFRGRIPVFIGDDTTDEDGFERVNLLGGHSIRVGAGRTAARFRLADPAGVVSWLEGALPG